MEISDKVKRRLADEAEQLIAGGMERQAARRQVWERYQAVINEQAAPKPTANQALKPTKTFFTPERLAKNRNQLAIVKKLVKG